MEYTLLCHTLYRGLFHIIAGSLPAIALLFFPRFWVQIGLTAATILFLSFEAARLRIPSLNKWFSTWAAPLLRQEEHHKFTGSSYLLVGYLITALVFPQDIATLAILFASLGDPVATIVGVWKGRIRIWNKSIEGNIACFLVCLFIGFLVAIARGNPPLTIAIPGALIATLFQALPLRLNDNLTISIGSAAAMVIIRILI